MNVWDVVSAKVILDLPETKALVTAGHSIAATFGYAAWLAVLLHGSFIAMIGLWSFALVMIGSVIAATGPTVGLSAIVPPLRSGTRPGQPAARLAGTDHSEPVPGRAPERGETEAVVSEGEQVEVKQWA